MTTPTTDVTLDLRSSGQVSDRDLEYARTKVLAALRHASQPVLHARARLTLLHDPALARPAVAQVNVDLDGRIIRSQVAAASLAEAVDELHGRLTTRLQRAARHWEAIRGSRPAEEPSQWRHAQPAGPRPEYFPRPPEERAIVRHKTFTPPGATVDEAAFDMEMLDYDFLLFTEMGSGQVSVLYRAGEDGGYRLAQVVPQSELVVDGVTPVVVSPQGCPVLTEREAVDRLEQSRWPFVFFRDAGDDRGRLLYHRYDGHYGLITPAD